MSTNQPYYGNEQGGAPPQGPYPTYYRQPAAGCSTFLFRGFIVLLILFLTLAFIGLLVGSFQSNMQQLLGMQDNIIEQHFRGAKAADQKVAVITVGGFIMESEDGFVAKQIRQVLADRKVVAVVLRVDSPGGTMTGSDYYHHLLKKMKGERNIPVIVSMGSMATSGGYYVSMVGDEIFAEPTTITGSIGVIVSHYNGSELLKKIGVEADPIISGPHKAMGSFSKEMSEEERALWQKLVDENFDRFKEVIREGRSVFAQDPEKLDGLATGRVFMAREALENNLIDQIGYLDDAIDQALIRAGLNDGNCRTVRYKAQGRLSVPILGSGPEKPLGLESLTEITTPRLYMLYPYVVPTGKN